MKSTLFIAALLRGHRPRRRSRRCCFPTTPRERRWTRRRCCRPIAGRAAPEAPTRRRARRATRRRRRYVTARTRAAEARRLRRRGPQPRRASRSGTSPRRCGRRRPRRSNVSACGRRTSAAATRATAAWGCAAAGSSARPPRARGSSRGTRSVSAKPSSPVERERRKVGHAQLDVQRCGARDQRGFGEPREHAMRDAGALVRRAHGEEHEVSALLPEGHDREAGDARAVARHDRRRVAVGDHCRRCARAGTPIQARSR